MSTSLMFAVAAAFLIFCGAGFAQIEFITLAITKAIVNADVALFIANVV